MSDRFGMTGNYLVHSAKGSSWEKKDHKYIRKYTNSKGKVVYVYGTDETHKEINEQYDEIHKTTMKLLEFMGDKNKDMIEQYKNNRKRSDDYLDYLLAKSDIKEFPSDKYYEIKRKIKEKKEKEKEKEFE